MSLKQLLTDSRCVVGVAEKYFRRRIRQAAAAGLKSLAGTELVGEAEVRQLDHAELFEEDDVLRFQVSVVVHVAAVCKLEHEVELCLGVDDLVQADDVRMLDKFHQSDFLQHLKPGNV